MVERAFGLMKNKFRILKKMRFRSLQYTTEITNCACILQNLCLAIEPDRYIYGLHHGLMDEVNQGYCQESEIGAPINDNRRELVAFFQ